jgi:diacylglycerol kinase (ATP)
MTIEKTRNSKPGHTGLYRIYRAGLYSAKGLRAAFVGEAAFRQELAIAVIGTLLLPLLTVSLTQKLLMWFALMLLLIVELLNSAIEAVVDRVSNEHHPLSGQAKDMGSAAVLLSLILCAGIWIGALSQYF